MANYHASARSNYFKVKDVTKFKQFCEDLDMTFIENTEGAVGFLCEETQEGSIPTHKRVVNQEESDFDDWEEVDFDHELSKHLENGEIAVYMEVGHEKFRYLVGAAVAVNSHGETCEISINDIYQKATGLWGHTPRQCIY